MLVDSLVLSCLIYALPVWGPLLSQSNTHRLQRLHNWGVRITASLHKFDHVSEHRANFDWLSVSSLIKYRCLCALHKIYMGDGTMLDPPVVLELIINITLDLLRNLFSQHFVDYPLLRNCLDILLRTGGMICLMKLLCPPLFLPQCIIYYCVMMCNLYVYFFVYLLLIAFVPVCLL